MMELPHSKQNVRKVFQQKRHEFYMDLIQNGKIGQPEVNNTFLGFTQNKNAENKDSSRQNGLDLDDLFSMKSSKVKTNSNNNSKA